MQNFNSTIPSTFITKKIATCCALLLPIIYYSVKRYCSTKSMENNDDEDAEFANETTNPPLLKRYSTFRSYHVSKTGFTYPSIRTFYRQHPQIGKLPAEPTPLPLLVAVHGLGGSIAQFHPILSSLVDAAPTLAIDLPGCGISSFEPQEKEAYTADALVHLLVAVIEKYRNVGANQGVIFVCHSMGCSLGTLLASTTSPYRDLISEHVCAVVSICPSLPLSQGQILGLKLSLLVPESVFECLRERDRRGGTESTSVVRLTGPNADKKTKKMQLLFNKQSRTPVWRHMASGGLLPDSLSDPPFEGIPGEKIWKGMKIHVLLIAGQDDHTTPADNISTIASWLEQKSADEYSTAAPLPVDISLIEVKNEIEPDSSSSNSNVGPSKPAAKTPPLAFKNGSAITSKDDENHENGLQPRAGNIVQNYTPISNHGAAPVKTTVHELDSHAQSTEADIETIIFPSPAAHALLFAEDTARILSANVQKFLSKVDERLDPGWQLHHLNQGGKWDVKNVQKWKEVESVSRPIAGFFRALKTLREVDPTHTPRVFARDWSPTKGNGKDGLGSIAVVIDITHDSPVYDPEGLRSGGISYIKWPTVSKFPPTAEKVKDFIDLVDSVRSDVLSASQSAESGADRLIAVHCHYGFNRTGFFIVAYMVERLGWSVKDAIAEFADAKKPGIKHKHFIDELYAQYPNS
ncbi:hypothetical protein FKW77_008847 [Venturia effusa]|uniref:Tyrosine specific protein phosphatases domain-containing protein n=1 Tax=Venturia effusa TaxID=50376 RepID=A0A517L3Z6_9PEZI|nr:hypothetical protein FKW77_008847 [Venturia effusa]